MDRQSDNLKYLKNGGSTVVEVDKAQIKRKIQQKQEQQKQEQQQLE